MKNNLAGVVIAYNPSEEIVENINSYVRFLDVLYVIDNSSSDNSKLFLDVGEGKIQYLFDGVNKGISSPINYAARAAYELGVEWLLTMDQDSQFQNLDILTSYLSSDKDRQRVGIYSPFHESGMRKRMTNESVSYVKSVMTSGNIVNINIFNRVGGLDENFFIDRVDHDFCLRLIEHGYFIKQINYCTLKHNLGNIDFRVSGVEVTNHSPIRRYYITRNFFYFIEKHLFKKPLFCLRYTQNFFCDLYRVFRYEKQRRMKIKYIAKGFSHYLIRVKGRIN